jgi:hyaluronan synthase
MRKRSFLFNPYLFLLIALYVLLLQANSLALPHAEAATASLLGPLAFGSVVALFLVIFALALRYRLPRDASAFPTVSVLVPVKNEEAHIYQTLAHLAASDYPPEQLQIVVINDGSTDGTAAEIRRFTAQHPDVLFLDFPENRGKREALISGIEATESDVVVFIDSDTFVAPDAVRVLAQSLTGATAAVSGEVRVQNVHANVVTKMQEFDYFISFNFFKAFESRFGVVTCCPGCFSSFKRSALLEVLPSWGDQIVLGTPCSYGEDRYLTSLVLEHGAVRYQRAAKASTLVPDTLGGLFRQRLRWCRSWFINSLLVSRFIWRKHLVASLTFYLIFLTTLLVPAWILDALLFHPTLWGLHLFFLLALAALQWIVCLALQRYRTIGRSPWYFALYFALLAWLVPLAIASLTDNRWGSRKG